VNGVNASLFIGLRELSYPPVDMATGVRFDIWQIDGIRSYSIAFQLDLLLPVIGAILVGEILSVKPH
jgi:hypothetical protein